MKKTWKKEATKQQQRKAKAAISVRALHDLQDTARPSDSFLFYATKLEGFIAMKTRPIHNSVSK